jgi:RHS repeat-associated protein
MSVRILTLDDVTDNLLAEYGLTRGAASSASYHCAEPTAVLLPIAKVIGPVRRKLNRDVLASILNGFRHGHSIPPVEVFYEPETDELVLLDGMHRWRASLAYDGGVAGPGNITSQTGVGTYTYPAAGQPRPHAVTSLTGTFNGITNPSFVYDANGNMTSRAGSTVTWSSYNYPTNINANDATGAEEVQLSYGPDRQRWKQIYTAPGTTENTYYIGGLLEKVLSGSTTNYRHYIYAGREAVAVYSRTAAGVNTMSYMLEDHQGGVSNIASNSGTSDVNESFSAFGTRRNPTTWSGAPTTGDLNTIAGLSRQGYTFQTWLGQSMGLNHMNGRVEDAILGRFLSPDPHITDPSNAQNYNRYSYVLNNPLSYVDPSGFDDCLLLGLNCPGGGEQVIPGGQSPDPSTPSPTITPGNLPDSLPGIDGMPEITVTGCGGIGVTCYDPSTWVQSPGVNTAPGLPLIPFDPSKLDTVTVTAQSGKPCMNTASTGTGPVPVVLNDGSTIPDANLPGGLLLQPADVSLSANAAIGQFSSDMDNRDATMLALFVPGGLMDYQRSYGSNGLINPTYIDFGNFNFGVVAAAMGYNQAQALAGAGLANLLGRGNKSGPFFTNPRNNVFINAGYSAFISGRIGC